MRVAASVSVAALAVSPSAAVVAEENVSNYYYYSQTCAALVSIHKVITDVASTVLEDDHTR